jgi:hypothetical protein
MTDHDAQPAPAAAPAATLPRACRTCGAADQPLSVIRSRGIGETEWREEWRCEDIAACNGRRFPELAEVISGRAEPRPAPGPVTHDVRFGAVRVTCGGCPGWSTGLDAGHDLADLARLASMHAGEMPGGDADAGDGREPYCPACGERASAFHALEGWHHFRGDPAPGGQRTLYAAERDAVTGQTLPPGRGLSPAELGTLRQALADAITYRDRPGPCRDCRAGLPCEDHAADPGTAGAYRALAAALGIVPAHATETGREAGQ